MVRIHIHMNMNFLPPTPTPTLTPHHSALLLVFPYLNRLAREGSTCASVSRSCFSIASITARPPGWRHTCSNAVLKSGM